MSLAHPSIIIYSKILVVNSRFTNKYDYYSTEYICQSKHYFTTALGVWYEPKVWNDKNYTTTVTLQWKSVREKLN
jgi:hypothetical protein